MPRPTHVSRILGVVNERPEGITASEIGKIVGVGSMSARQHLMHLAARGMIRRERDRPHRCMTYYPVVPA